MFDVVIVFAGEMCACWGQGAWLESGHGPFYLILTWFSPVKSPEIQGGTAIGLPCQVINDLKGRGPDGIDGMDGDLGG